MKERRGLQIQVSDHRWWSNRAGVLLQRCPFLADPTRCSLTGKRGHLEQQSSEVIVTSSLHRRYSRLGSLSNISFWRRITGHGEIYSRESKPYFRQCLGVLYVLRFLSVDNLNSEDRPYLGSPLSRRLVVGPVWILQRNRSFEASGADSLLCSGLVPFWKAEKEEHSHT